MGRSEVFISLTYHLYSVGTPGQVLEQVKEKPWSNPSLKFTQSDIGWGGKWG